MVFSVIEAAILFDETRSSALHLSDDEFAAELTRAHLAYLGVARAPAHPDSPAESRRS